jgi:hypothetical protein
MTNILLSIAILLCTVVSGNIEYEKNKDPETAIGIVLQKGPLGPRTPDYCSEISAYYQNGVIYLQFSEDLGCMDVQVINLSTGELWSDNASGTAVVNRTYTLNGKPFTSHKLTIVK